MPNPRRLPFLACLLSALAVSPGIHAGSWDKSFVMNVSEPIIAGNKVLTPGSYVWKLMDSPSDRHIVQISDQKTGHVEATILAIPKYRTQVTSKNELEFWETPKGVPRAIRSWFYPGDNYGQEFPYPKKLIALLGSLLPDQAASPEPPPAPAKTVASVLAPKKKSVKRIVAARAAAPRKPVVAAVAKRPAVPAKIAALPKQVAAAKHRGGLWEGIKNLPVTATIASLIGLIGIASFVFFLMSIKRKPRKATV